MQRPKIRHLFGTVAAICAAGGLVTAALAQSSGGLFNAEEYFSGKTIEIVINAGPGGGLDTTSRFFLQGLEEHIPGSPEIAPVNISDIPGVSAVFDAPATDDQITIGVTSRVATLYATTLDTASTHDPEQISVLGGYGGIPQWMVVFNDAAESYDSLADASGAQEPVLVTTGKVGDATQLFEWPLVSSWMCDTFNLPCRLISAANADMVDWAQDIERGQINMVNSTANALVRLTAEKLISGEAKILVEYAEEGASELDTPYPRPNIDEAFPSEATAEEFQNLLPLIASGGIGNAVFAGPQVPEEALAIIAKAVEERAKSDQNLQAYERGRFGEYEGHDFRPTVLGREDAQQIYEAGMQRFFANQDFYKELQTRLYEKYWK